MDQLKCHNVSWELLTKYKAQGSQLVCSISINTYIISLNTLQMLSLKLLYIVFKRWLSFNFLQSLPHEIALHYRNTLFDDVLLCFTDGIYYTIKLLKRELHRKTVKFEYGWKRVDHYLKKGDHLKFTIPCDNANMVYAMKI